MAPFYVIAIQEWLDGKNVERSVRACLARDVGRPFAEKGALRPRPNLAASARERSTFKIGDEVTAGGPGVCAFFPRNVPHAWKSTGCETGRVLFMCTPRPQPAATSRSS